MQRKGASVATALLLVAVWAIFDSVRYGLGTLTAPGAGLFPLILAVGLCVLSLVLLLQAATAPTITDAKEGERLTEDQKPSGRFWFLAVSLFAYAFMLEPFGFLVSSFICLCALFKAGNSWRWPKVVVASAVSVGAAYVVFVVLLRVPLPRGYWS